MADLDLGVQGAKREPDELLVLMQKVVDKYPTASRQEHVEFWLEEISDEKELCEKAQRYAGYNIRARCDKRPEELSEDEKEIRATVATEMAAKARRIVESDIRLGRARLPGLNGKVLMDCTFGEVADAAPLVGKWLHKLSKCGAPGTLVREVFKNEHALQEFWSGCQ